MIIPSGEERLFKIYITLNLNDNNDENDIYDSIFRTS